MKANYLKHAPQGVHQINIKESGAILPYCGSVQSGTLSCYDGRARRITYNAHICMQHVHSRRQRSPIGTLTVLNFNFCMYNKVYRDWVDVNCFK